MSSISPELIAKLVPLQNVVWQNVTQTVTSAAGVHVTFSEAECHALATADMYAECTAPMMVIQFAFAHAPENNQVVLIDEVTAGKLAAELGSDSGGEGVDENTIADIRSSLEAIVQGVCLAIGQIKGDTIVASGLTIRHQVFSFPQNLQHQEQVCRSEVKIAASAPLGKAIWLIDKEAVQFITGDQGQDHGTPFPQVEGDSSRMSFTGNTSFNTLGARPEDMNGLDLLLDIPLEISVELGRVKMLVKDVVELGTGSIVEIDKAAGEPVDVMVNGKLVARGEVVVIEDNFGVRVTEILNPADRLRNLGEVA